MNLGNLLIEQLEKHRSAGRLPSAPGEAVRIVAVNSAAAETEVTQVDGLGVAFTRLVVSSAAGEEDFPAGRLEQIGSAIASRVTYLGEPLALLEHDGRLRRALLRSAQPYETSAGIEYFEGWLKYDPPVRRLTFSLNRYRQGYEDAQRSTADAIVTRQVFTRLVNDLETLLTAAE